MPLDFDHGVGVLRRNASLKQALAELGGLSMAPMCFNAMMRAIDSVPHRMLTLALRCLECDGLVKRTAYATIPPKIEHELARPGRSLIEP